MNQLTAAQLWGTLNDLLTGRGHDDGDELPGAELAVFDDDVEVFRAALARHARRDDDDPAVIWVRPLVVPAGRRHGLPAFDIGVVRRRALHVRTAAANGEGLDLGLMTGQRAVVQPARGPQLAVLQDFDTWTATLSALERAEIEALDHD
jgi:hypothetical protein